jgi:hypothetical protein
MGTWVAVLLALGGCATFPRTGTVEQRLCAASTEWHRREPGVESCSCEELRIEGPHGQGNYSVFCKEHLLRINLEKQSVSRILQPHEIKIQVPN